MEEKSIIRNFVIYAKGISSVVLLFFVTQYFTILTIIPPFISAPGRKKFYKKNLRWLASFILNTHFNIKTEYLNPHNEDFSKPAVIVINHQTVFDVLVTFSLSYKLFVITNDWLQRTFFRFFMIKYLDNLSITEGSDVIINKAKELMTNGYSPVIFPEGARTKNKGITRFHKGAFVMAAALDLEIIPVVVYASEGIHRRKWFYAKTGIIRVYIGERIKPSNPDSHEEIRNQSKSMAAMFRQNYSILQQNKIPS